MSDTVCDKRKLIVVMHDGNGKSIWPMDSDKEVQPTIYDIKAYLADQGLAVVPAEPNGNMVKAALHTIPTEWGVCTGRQMMDIYEAMATAAGEG